MRVIVTDLDIEYEGFTVVRSLSEVNLDEVDALIYHRSEKDAESTHKDILKLGNESKKLIYIANPKIPVLQLIFSSYDADIYDDETYLMDSDILNYFVTDYKNTGMTEGNSEEQLLILNEGLGNLQDKDSKELESLIKNPLFVERINSTVTELALTNSYNKEIFKDTVQVLNSLTDTVENLSKNAEDVRKKTSKLYEDLEDARSRAEAMNSLNNNTLFFPTYTVSGGVSKVFYVRCHSDVMYLTSFIMNYAHYLKMEKRLTVKTLFVLQKNKQVLERYKTFATRLAPDSIDIIDYKKSDIFRTHEPVKSVLDKFFSQQSVDLYIVVDKLLDEPIINKGGNIVNANAVGTIGLIQKFKLNPSETIVPITIMNGNIQIPYLKAIATTKNLNELEFRSIYYKKSAPSFQLIDELVGIDRIRPV